MAVEITVRPRPRQYRLGQRASAKEIKQRDLAREEEYDPADTGKGDRVQPPVPVAPMGEMSAYDPTLRDSLAYQLSRPLSAIAPSDYAAMQTAKGLVGLAEWNPLVGMATSGSDFADAYQRGDRAGMVAGGLGVGLNALGAGAVGRMLTPGFKASQFPWGEGDPFKWKVR